MDHDGKEAIAIVGMSCRLPKCSTLEDFWNILEKGESTASTPPDSRWQQKDYSSIVPEICRETNAGFLSQNVDEFAANFFETNAKEAVCTDPQHRIMYELVWEGLEDAGIDPHSLRGTDAGVFTGSWTTDYKDILSNAGYDDFYLKFIGNSIGARAAKISHFLGLTGPSISTESACASSIVALHLACSSLRKGETGLALVSGINLLLKPFHPSIMGTATIIFAPDGKCKPFDQACDGFGSAEGGGCLVLKRLSDAVNEGDRIWAVIKGTAISQDGTSSSMGTPTVENESKAMKLALDDANVNPSDVSFVEAHATGTVVGDPIEASAIKKVYSGGREEPLIIGSVKGNVGHTESCSGITSIIKVVLAMNHGSIPKQANFNNVNSALHLETIPAVILKESKNWKPRLGKKRIAGVNSFGFTGTATHVILEEPPISKTVPISTSEERSAHIIKISASTEDSLDIFLERLKTKLEKGNEHLHDIAYTANTGRANFKLRAAIIANTKEDAVASILSRRFMRGEVDELTNNKICFLFTGQGSQYPRMGMKLYDTSPVFKEYFDKCATFLKVNYNLDIKEKLWRDDQNVSETMISQTGIFSIEFALLKLWESWGIEPDYVLGHSLGEFAAAVCSGILSLEDALILVAERSRLIDQLPRGKMLVIKASQEQVKSTLDEFGKDNEEASLDFAAFNSSEQTVVAGDSDIISAFSEYLEAKGIKNVFLHASHAFHSRHMDPMLNEYGEIAKAKKLMKLNREAKCKFISGMKGELMTGNEIDMQYWVDQTRNPVSFLKACQVAIKEGCRVFIEIDLSLCYLP